ncbi:MAG: DUF4861 family protein [Kiritimatiellia bacterium]
MKSLCILGLSLACCQPSSAGAGCACGVAERRAQDFFWENDKFGMRAYGPDDVHKWSGLDVFNKTAEGSVRELLADPGNRGNWHVTPWRGVLDNYAVGAGRGLGGVALWGDGEWKTYPGWESCEILADTPEKVEFRLVYPAFSAMGRMTYRITLARGSRFFRNEVSFERSCPEGFLVGPGLDLAAGRGHAGDVWEDPALGLVSLCEHSRGEVEGATMTAVVLDPASAQAVEFRTDHLGCRILALRSNAFAYYAGATWSRAGEIATAKEWHETVRNFRKELGK